MQSKDYSLDFWEAQIEGAKKEKQTVEVGKFKNHCRQNSLALPDSEIKLPETARNQARQEQVDAYMKANGGSRRAARKATQR